MKGHRSTPSECVVRDSKSRRKCIIGPFGFTLSMVSEDSDCCQRGLDLVRGWTRWAEIEYGERMGVAGEGGGMAQKQSWRKGIAIVACIAYLIIGFGRKFLLQVLD